VLLGEDGLGAPAGRLPHAAHPRQVAGTLGLLAWGFVDLVQEWKMATPRPPHRLVSDSLVAGADRRPPLGFPEKPRGCWLTVT
jgi:hypothetical protein